MLAIGFLGALGIGLGTKAIGSLFGGGKKKAPRYDMRAWDSRVAQAGRTGAEVENEYLKRLRSFDPMQAATAASQAQYTMAMPLIQQALGDLRGQQVGQGRLNTGYGQTDQDELLRRNLENLNQSIIARSMDATRMQMANTSELGQYGVGQSNLYYDATLGRYQTEEDRRAAEAASKRGMWGGLLGSAIGAAGSYFGSR